MPNLVKNKHRMGSPEERARELIKERMKYSGRRNSGHLRLLRKFWRYYLTSVEARNWFKAENDRDPGSGAEWRANLFVPAVFSVIETAVPRIVFALFGQQPFVKVRGRERSDMERAPAVEAMLNYDFEQSQILLKAIDFFKSYYVFGTAVGRIDYHRDFYELKHPPTWDIDLDIDENGEILDAKPRKVENTERVSRYDGPRFTPVSLFDFFPDPMYHKLEDMRYVAEREETSLDQLKDRNEKHRKATGQPLYKNLADIKPYHEGQMEDLGEVEDMRHDTAEVMRFDFGLGGGKTSHLEEDDDTVILYHYWENDRYVVMANGHEIIRDTPNPYNDKRVPYVAATCFPTLQEFYGQGLVNPIQYLQEELNTIRNIALDQGKMNMEGIWAIDENVSSVSDADLAMYPGKQFYAEFVNGKPPIEQVFQSTLPSDFERLEGRVQQDIQSALAINDYMVGAGSGSAGTASEAAMLNASAANRFRLQALISQESFVAKMADMFLARRQQFLDKPKVFRVLGEQGYWYPEITPEEIAGRYDFEPQGSQSQPNKEVLRQQMMQMVSIAASNPQTMAMTNWPEVYKELWGMFDFRFSERFMLMPPEKQLSQTQENYILLQGEKVAVEPNEPHDQHIEQMTEAMAQAEQMGDPRIQEAVQDHFDNHMRFLQGQQGAAGGGQTPGAISGAPGNTPNTAEQQVPSMPSMQANVMGGPGGPVT